MLGTKFRQIFGYIQLGSYLFVLGVEFIYVVVGIYGSMNEWVIMFTSGLRFVSIKVY